MLVLGLGLGLGLEEVFSAKLVRLYARYGVTGDVIVMLAMICWDETDGMGIKMAFMNFIEERTKNNE
jgi:hypothetical protein